MTRDEAHRLILSLPHVEEGTSWGYPSYKAAGKFLTRIRDEDASLALYVASIDERDMLLEADPESFHITDHYRNYPMILARIERVDPAWLEAVLLARWRKLVPRKLQAASPDRRS